MSQPRKSFYILLPILSCLIAVLLLELGLALFYPIPFSLEKNMYFETDPYTGFRHKPLSEGFYPTGITAIANSRGHRDAEIELPKPDDMFRILVLGDSFTVGANVEQEEAYPQVLELLLRDAVDRPLEVVNTGTGGWAPFQYAQYYEHYGQELDPDLVIIGFFVGNDTYVDRSKLTDTRSAVLGRRLPRDIGQDGSIKLKVFLYENSHIARALMSGGGTRMEFVRESCDEFPDYYTGVQANRMPNHLAEPTAEKLALLDMNVEQISRIQELAADNDVPMLVVVLPDENQLNPTLQAQIIEPADAGDYDFAMPQKLLHERFASRGIDYLDLKDVIGADQRCLFMNDTHWIPEGHKLVARQIRKYLLQQRLLNE